MKGVSPSNVLVALGMSKSNLGRWKQGGSLTNETKKKIADHLCVPLSQLLDKKEKPASEEHENDVNNVKVEVMNKFKQLIQQQRRNFLLR